MVFEEWGDILKSVFVKMVNESIIPVLLVFLLVLIGYLIGSIFKIIVVRFVDSTRVNDWLEEQNIKTTIGGHTIAVILGSIVQWSVIALFLSQAALSLNLQVISGTLFYIATTFIWGILLAFVIFTIGLLAGRYVRNMIEVSDSRFKHFFAVALEAIIVYMSIIMAIGVIRGADQKPIIPVDILHQTFLIAFGGIVLAAALAIGLSFGFALKDDAKDIIRQFRDNKEKK